MNVLGTSKSNTNNNNKKTYVNTPFKQLLVNKPPWGKYSASSWVQGTQTLIDETGNGRHGVGGGGVSLSSSSGNGATASIPYIQGLTTDTILFPNGSIPTAHTICCISRYASATTSKQHRILTSTSDNIVIGHHLNKRGVLYNGTWKTLQTTVGPTLDWLNLCYTNGIYPNSNNVLVNGVGQGIASGGNGIVSRLSINLVSVYTTEVSDFQLSQLLIWDVVLTPAEMIIVSNAYTQFLSTGILS